VTDVKQRARTLAAQALAAARKDDYPAASALVRQLNAECGSEGTMHAICGWIDTLAAKSGISEKDAVLALGFRDAGTGQVHLGSEGVPDRIRWAGQLIIARARLDEPMFRALISALPADKTAAGSYVGAVLETVACTINDLLPAKPEEG
jgi:hypothetical protein